MQRVLVIGSPGAGKSTFARALAARTGLPLVHLDQHYHLPGWVEPAEDVWAVRLDQLLGGDRWIMDGNFGGSMERRLARADTAILLDFPTWLCLWRVIKRVVTLRGSVRPDMAPGCPEKLDLPFLVYVARFRGTRLRAIAARLAKFRGQVVRFTRPSEAQAFLDRLG